ncbi:translation initiation factor IF-2 [Candidatus Saccharibacteria bacterium]|jgi:translation initiation factor IF-2|nr:translation initiation factor IF-2 [Candidatus Saccharibacteria bacterium]HPR09712.1 translation initiation factor IF-2 [Candidatus Saccharibacteria bacterium]
MATQIEIDDHITVGALAEVLRLPVSKLIGELFKNGIMATINERLDFDTAQIIVGELGLDVTLTKKVSYTEPVKREKPQHGKNAAQRPPVVAVMGHVDHGKTSLLDAVRGASVAKGEAGGITQHISAYQIEHKNRLITLLDTPGHEAFAAIREHGAHLTDIVVIVVAADDGVKPQTIEAIRFARKAGVRIVVAINKIDKEGANENQVKQQLAEQELLVEEWGGDIVAVPVSAKTKQGIPELLDMLLLITDVEELKADATMPARGLIIEAHVEHGRGSIAHALIEEGTLKVGDFVVAGPAYAKIRNLETTKHEPITSAGPSTPVIITGFKALPEFGDPFIIVKTEKEARQQATIAASERSSGQRSEISGTEMLRLITRKDNLQELAILVKADVQGSLTSVIDSLKTIDTDEVAVRVVSSSVGVVNENDIHIAHSSKAIVYGFNTSVASNVKRIASRDQVSIRLYNVIYELIDDVKAELSELLSPEVIEHEIGTLEVKGVFKTTKTEIICGGEVKSGKLVAPAEVRIFRGKEQIAEAKLKGLKRGPNDARDLTEGELGGLELQTVGRIALEVGDTIRFFTRETKQRTL